MAISKVIIDTDPGTDDILALLLALASSPSDIEVLLISVTYGNVDIQNCLRNVVSMFNVIEKEMQWRKDQGLPEGFEALKGTKPVVAVGAKEPLGGQTMMADYYHGVDGLGNVHETHPHHTSHPDVWSHLFDAPPTDTLLASTATEAAHIPRETHTNLFTPSSAPSHLEILDLLASNPPDTITLIGIGPLTNFALAASTSPITFLRAKEVVVMSGAIAVPGNITPVAEFNSIADPLAAAYVYALTSPDPASTLPPLSMSKRAELSPYPSASELGPERLSITLFPLDITMPHTLSQSAFNSKTEPLIARDSPLAEWVSAFLTATFVRSASLYDSNSTSTSTPSAKPEIAVCFHDPICIWYALSSLTSTDPSGWSLISNEDVRVETMGQWTRGMYVVDRRGRKRVVGKDGDGHGVGGDEGAAERESNSEEMGMEVDGEGEEEAGADNGNWLDLGKGNRLARCVGTPGREAFQDTLLRTLFGDR